MRRLRIGMFQLNVEHGYVQGEGYLKDMKCQGCLSVTLLC